MARFVADRRIGSDTRAKLLAITGPEGIGKTTIWRAAVDELRSAGTCVLVGSPAPEELQAAMVGLFDLFGGIDGAEVSGDPRLYEPDTELFTRGRLVLSTLQQLSTDRLVVLAIDDLQWLDPISTRCLRYALRRLDRRAVSVLATGPHLEGSGTTTIAAPGEIEKLEVGPLSSSELRSVLEARGLTLSRPSLELLHQVSGGNPSHAIELALTIDFSGDRLSLAELSPLRSATSMQLARMVPAVAEVVRVCAALGPTPLAVVEQVAVDVAALADALSDGSLVTDDSLTVRCGNPSLGSAALGEMTPAQRRALHARIASLMIDPDVRARHLALSQVDRDARVADQLASASSRAAQRGAPGLAAELLAHSRRLTPLDDLAAAGRRTVLEILRRAAAGETARALSMIDDLLNVLPPGRERANLLTLRAGLDFRQGDNLLARALDEAGDDDALRGRVLDQMAFAACSYQGKLARAEELASSALAIAHQLDDAELEVLASGTVADAAALSGNPKPELLDHAINLSKRAAPRLGRWPEQYLARHALWGGRLDQARRIFAELAQQCQGAGIEFQRPFRLFDLALVELGAGRLTEAAEHVGDGMASAGDAGNEQAQIWLSYPAGLVEAHCGTQADVPLCSEGVGDVGGDGTVAASTMMQWGIEHDEPTRMVMAYHVLGVHALARGRADEAYVALSDGSTMARDLGHRHPGSIPVLPDAVEAATAAGHADRATELCDELIGHAAALGEPWVDAAARRAQGLIALHAGDSESAEHLEAAASQFSALGYHLDAARSCLLQGRALRRLGRRSAAASVLTDARHRFDEMGASPWSRQTTEELDRVAPGRGSAQLTRTEGMIAALVADGLRNREIAHSLFVSVATVEAHLTRIYRKLGLRSRTELARHVRDMGTS